MSNVVIRAENLGKKYIIGHQAENGRYSTFRDIVAQNVRGVWDKTRDLMQGKPIIQGDIQEEVWALKDVNFEIRQGEAVGIIGRNGAGKSTLLKILSRITEPSTGRVTIKGRVASLLEVGTGFHPELSGRENVYLNGAILGMTRAEIKRKFDEIVDFSGVDKYIDTPVKRYSSGMHVRLAFAVAAHLEPEILVVDEVLAVGDAEFQKKSLGKMEGVAGEGRTVLFVSHNMGAIRQLCPRSILLHKGNTAFDGNSDEAVNYYLQNAVVHSDRRVFFDDNQHLPFAVSQVAITSPGKSEVEPLDISDPLYIEIYYSVENDMKGSNISFSLMRNGVVLFRSWDIDSDKAVYALREKGTYMSRLRLPQGLLPPGIYSIEVSTGRPGMGVIDKHDDCLTFELMNISQDNTHYSSSRKSLVVIPIEWQTRSSV